MMCRIIDIAFYFALSSPAKSQFAKAFVVWNDRIFAKKTYRCQIMLKIVIQVGGHCTIRLLGPN